MIVVEDQKRLLMKLDNPARVLSALSTASYITLQNANFVSAPHSVDEVRVLRNLGINAPSPILHYYDWPGQFKPFEHQRETAAFLTTTQRGLVLNEIGTAKTLSALWAADFLMKEGLVERCLVVSPLSTLERVWMDAVFKHFPERRCVVLHGSAQKRRKLLAQEVDFYIVNHDGFKVLSEDFHGLFDLVIVDEAAVLRNHSSDRYKIFYRWLLKQDPAMRLWLMTGTPTPNEPTDAWTLAKLVGNPMIPASYYAFREMVMRKVAAYTWVPQPMSAEIVKSVLQPSVRYTRDDCFDLPDTIVQTRYAPLSAQQEALYKEMYNKFVAEAATGTIVAVNEAVKAQKLVQIACGVAYDEQGNNVELDCSPRINAVKEVIEEAGQKVIVFVPLTGTLRMLERELSKRWTVAVVNGEVSAKERGRIFNSFQNDPDPRVLIAHPATMAHGLTLTAASTIVWYGPIYSNEQYTQANGRVERAGKKYASNVVHIEGTSLEARVYQRLSAKQKLQGLLLSLIQEEMERGRGNS